MNCCTIARKLVVSVLRRVVGALLQALDRRRPDFPTRPSMAGCEVGLLLLLLVEPAIAGLDVAVTTVESATADTREGTAGVAAGCDPMPCW